MSNKTIYKKKFAEVQEISNSNSGIKIGKDWSLTDSHEQDCCENVYADWDALKAHESWFGSSVTGITIKSVKGMGFLLCFEVYGTYKYFVPCYNEQNGYYSSELHLVVKDGKDTKIIDISDSVIHNEG